MTDTEANEVMNKLGRWKRELDNADTVNRSIALQLIAFGEWATKQLLLAPDPDGEIGV